MEEKTYTLNIRQTGKFQYEVTIPEIGATKMAPTLDSALNITSHDILKHLMTRYRILVFELSRPLTREQGTWLDGHVGKLFDGYYIKDELEGEFDALREEAHDN